LARAIVRSEGEDSAVARAIGKDWKGYASLAGYIAGIALAFVNPWISCGIFAAVAVIWFLPDRRIERVLGRE
jgi:uncharacterized membrane protein